MSQILKLDIETPPKRRRSERRRRVGWVIALAVIVAWGVTDVRRRARIDPANPTAHKTDFTVYTEAGAAFFDGRDPYDVTNPRGWHYLYPPLFAILVAPLHRLDSQNQALVWYFFSVAACAGCVWETRRLLRFLGCERMVFSPPSATNNGGGRWNGLTSHIGILACAAAALPVLNCLQRGQVGVVLVYLLLLGARLAITSERVLGVAAGGVVLALPVAIKLTPLLPAGYLALVLVMRWVLAPRTYGQCVGAIGSRSHSVRAAAASVGMACGGLLFLFLIPGLAVGSVANWRHLQTWVGRVAANKEVGADNEFNARGKRNQSLANATRRLTNFATHALAGGPNDQLVDDLKNNRVAMPAETAALDWLLRATAGGLIGLLGIAAWRVCRREDAAAVPALFGLSAMASLLVSPLSWGHHYVLWQPALIFAPAWLAMNGNARTAVCLGRSAVALVVGHYLLLEHLGRVGWLGLGATAWFAVATWKVAYPQERSAAGIVLPFERRETGDWKLSRAA